MALGHQMLRGKRDRPLPGDAIEIDHGVSTEYELKPLTEMIDLHQVQPAEVHELMERPLHPRRAGLLPNAPLEVAAQQRLWNPRHAVDLVDTLLRRRDGHV